MLSVDAYLKAVAGLVCAAFGLALALGRPRRAPTLYLSAFLLLIAANQASEALRALVPPEDPRHLLGWRTARVFAALDPLFLLLFAASYPHREGQASPRALLATLVAAGVLALWVGWTPPVGHGSLADHLFNVSVGVFTALVYGVVLAWAFRGLLAEPGEVAWRYLVPAVVVVTLPQWAQTATSGVSLGLVWTASHETPAAYAFGLLLGFVAGPLVAWALLRRAARRHPPDAPTRRLLVLTAACTLLLMAVLNAYAFHRALLGLGLPLPLGEGLQPAGRSGAAVRWLLFGALVSVAVLRHDAMGLRLAARRRAARVLMGVVLFTAAALAFAFARLADGARTLDLPPVALLGIALLLVLSQGFRSVVDVVAARAYGVPMPGDLAARQQAYRLAAGRALARGVDPAADPGLARLREELALDEPVARALERSADAEVDAPLVPGHLVAGRYRVDRLLGRGGSGRVFLARDETLRRQVVLKEVPEGAEGERALREARLAGSVQHPYVVTVHDVVPRPGGPLLVTEFVPGGTLDDLLARRGPLPPREALPLLERLLEGLAAVHATGIVHRDLNPSNVLLQAPEVPKLADFGIASARRPTMGLGEGPHAGTPGFTAPEQARGEPATPRADVYAAGLLARRLVAAPLPQAVEAVVARALREDPAERWADAGEMLAALRGAVQTVQ